MSRYVVLSHTADTGIVTEGATMEAVIGNAAHAMFDLMYDLGGATKGSPITLEVDPAEPAELLVNVLGELLYRSEVDDVAFADVGVTGEGDRVVVTALAHPIAGLEATGPPVKAVTYHQLLCEPTADGWLARVIFDV